MVFLDALNIAYSVPPTLAIAYTIDYTVIYTRHS